MPETEIRIWSVEKGTTYRYNLDYTSIPVLAENYNPSYMLTSPVIEAVCYETIKGVPEELTIEIYVGFCDRDIRLFQFFFHNFCNKVSKRTFPLLKLSRLYHGSRFD